MNENPIKAVLQRNPVLTDGTEGERGYGFGLALINHLVNNLKGSIEIQSISGQGTIFEIALT